MRHVELIEVRFHEGNKFVKVLRRKVLFCRDYHRILRGQADRFEIDIRLVCETWIERDRSSVRPHLAHLNGVTIRIGAHRPGRPDRTASANDVLHHKLRSEEHTSELQSLAYIVCRLLL